MGAAKESGQPRSHIMKRTTLCIAIIALFGNCVAAGETLRWRVRGEVAMPLGEIGLRDVLSVTGGLILLILAAGMVLAYRHRRDIEILPYEGPEEDARFQKLAEYVRFETKEIIDTLKNARAPILQYERLGKLTATGSSLPIDAMLKELNSPFAKAANVLIKMWSWYWRPSRIKGQIQLTGTKLTILCTHSSRGEGTRNIGKVEREGFEDKMIGNVAEEVAMRIAYFLMEGSGLESWRVLGPLVDTLKKWPRTAIYGRGDERYSKIEERLVSLARTERNAGIATYYLGLVKYYNYSNDANKRARELFQRSARTQNDRLRALATMGVARTLCQDYHRYGNQTEDVRLDARDAANRAVEMARQLRESDDQEDAYRILLGEAYSAQAFSWHITERADHIAEAIPCYERSFAELAEDAPAVSLNNYALMLQARCGRWKYDSKHEETYDRIVKHCEEALRRDPRYKFALANIGQVHLLRRNFEKAEAAYFDAIKVDAGYANAHSELSRVYLLWGKPDEAKDYYMKALVLTGYPPSPTDPLDGQYLHASKIMETQSRTRHEMGDTEEARRIAEEAALLGLKNSELREWMRSLGWEIPGEAAGET